jgi:hypothetical protein
MSLRHTPVFILSIAERPAFAFEADNFNAATQISRSPWLLQALDEFCRARRPADGGQLFLRAATDHEAALYRDRADEFAEAETQFLIAHLI